MDTPDYHYSSLSELESLSDSDWLDIASSRGDADSIAAFDSDHEDADGRPISRRSFSSTASSHDEVIEGWEGLIEDSPDETPLADAGEGPMLGLVTTVGHTEDAPPASMAEDDPEDERVKAALDQSMMSTLSSSRPNSLANSVQTSVVHSTRSLRLSFPDPTTSPLRSLDTSYEELSPVEADLSAADVVFENAVAAAESTADSDDHITSDVPDDKALGTDILLGGISALKPNFSIVLYGSSPVAKLELVDMLLNKWARSCNMSLGQKAITGAHSVTHEYECFAQNGKALKRFVSIIDRTGNEHSSTPCGLDGPSLALIFLPSFSDISLSEHTLYLPVIMSSPSSVVDALGHTDYLLEAEQQWESLTVPSAKLTSFSDYGSPVVEQEVLDQATSSQVAHAFRPLLPSSPKTTTPRVSAHTLTMFAILSMVLGYIVHGSMNAIAIDTVTNRTISTPLWGLLRTTPVVADKLTPTSLLTAAASNASVATTSTKNLEVAVFQSSPLATLSVSSTVQPVPSSSTVAQTRPTSVPLQECDCGCGLLTWPGKTETMDVILRPTGTALTAQMDTVTSISVIPSQSRSHTHKGKGKAPASDNDDSSLYALSTRIVTSLSEYFDFSPLSKMVQQDMQEILEAIDQLVSVLSRQTSALYEQSGLKGTVSVIQQKFEKRNVRAKQRARQMREVGEKWLSSVKDQIKTKTELAKVNAKNIRERVAERMEARHRRSKFRSKEGLRMRRQRWSQKKIPRSVTI